MSFDIRQSPLAAYLYSCLGTRGVLDALSLHHVDFVTTPMTVTAARAVLRTLPRDAVRTVAQNMAKIAISRHELLLSIVTTLNDDDGDDDTQQDERQRGNSKRRNGAAEEGECGDYNNNDAPAKKNGKPN